MSLKRTSALLVAGFIAFNVSGTASALPQYGEELQDAPTTTASSVSFSDVPSNYWANTYISEMVTRNVFAGYPDGRFRPDKPISRAEVAKIVISAAGLKPSKVNYSSFNDIKSTDWESPFVETAKDYLSGYRIANGQYIFNPDKPATREDITVALVKLKGYDVNRLADRSLIQAMFKDYAGISESAKNYVAVAVENGLVSGYQDETFRPQAPVTRAEAATLLWRAYQYGNDNTQIGGNNPTTMNPGTTTPPATNPSSPTTPSSPSTTTPTPDTAADKFTVETLIGGAEGNVDGPVRKARLRHVVSMAADNNNQVYFLDDQESKVLIRKLDTKNGSVEKIQVDSRFDLDYKDADGKVQHIDHKYVTPTKLAYNNADNKMYMMTDDAIIYDITSGIQAVAWDREYRDDYRTRRNTAINFLTFTDTGSAVYSLGTYSSVWETELNASEPAQPQPIADSVLYESLGLDSHASAFVSGNTLNVASLDKLYRIQLFPAKVDVVASYKAETFDNIAGYEGRLYGALGGDVYELKSDGGRKTFIEADDLTYTDGTALSQLDQMTFDSNGNILFFDFATHSIRRINL
ncbi:S-layer homology domain-containing protein [Saccharibacillus sp. CPCC 101409]|uniref:S-layer homology domain-containing protein n=1 Tax=Saccharibacillus sp. CPCC 101409 TaxID=3058041 RepID=UPI0026734B82|nr:S-layer homology domain-containing protein [Saccharibacillus sp. CPCC 101409]MDO3411485.1 S-layer homology domain-containing protein [Saccharibacillus sp. CPCC 101409]